MISVTIQEVVNETVVSGGITVEVVAGGFNVDGVNAVWGAIDGTLSDQGDLQAALNAKAAASHTHSNAVASGAAGFMSGADKAKLDGVATGATAATPGGSVGQPQYHASGGVFGATTATYDAATGQWTFVYTAAAANSVLYPVVVRRITSGTPAVGIGSGLAFEVQTGVGNVEVGALTEVKATTITSGQEIFEWRTTVMGGGTLTNQAFLSLTPSSGHSAYLRLAAPAGGGPVFYIGGSDANGGIIIGTSVTGTTGEVVLGQSNGLWFGPSKTIGWGSTASLNFNSSASIDTGLKRESAGVVGVTNGSTGYGTMVIADGTDALPGLRFGLDPNNGVRRNGTDDWSLIVAGFGIIRMTASQVIFGAAITPNGASITGDRNEVTAVSTTRALNTTQDLGRSYSNTGATGEAIIDLPQAATGFNFRFAVTAAQYLRIRVPAWEPTSVIRNGASVSAAGGYIRSNVVGSALRIECMKTGEWFVTEERGTWTIDS